MQSIALIILICEIVLSFGNFDDNCCISFQNLKFVRLHFRFSLKLGCSFAGIKILIVEDEPELLGEIKSFLEAEGYVCETTLNFSRAKEKLEMYQYDVVLLDISLPDGSGLDLLEVINRICKNTGILIVSAKNSLDDKLLGLDLGADDYITKPFHLAELNSRIKAISRRRKFDGAIQIVHNEISIEPENKSVLIHQKPIVLTKKEYELLLFFIANKNRLLTREVIAEHLWGDNIDLADSFDFIYTHINNLRKKIQRAGGTDYLKTIYGMGYKYTDG